MSNQRGDLERDPSVSELQATVDALREDLVDATERIRELEAATDGVTPGGSGRRRNETAGSSDTATDSVDPGALDALADGSIDGSDEVTVGDLGTDGDEDVSSGLDDTSDSSGFEDTPGMPGRDPTKHPQNTQDAELVDAGSDDGSSHDEPDADRSSATTSDPTASSTSEAESVRSETTETDEDDDSDDIIVA